MKAQAVTDIKPILQRYREIYLSELTRDAAAAG